MWHIIAFHHPPYTSGNHIGDENVQTYLVPLFEQPGIDFVFSGRNHQYERSYKDGFYYIVAIGGGAFLYVSPTLTKTLTPRYA